MSSIDNSLEGGGGSASASGKKGVIQLSDGNFNLTSNKDLKSDPATGTITTTGLTTTGTIFAGTVSTTSLIVDTLTESLTVVGDASITGNAIVDGTISTTGNAYFSSNVGVGTTDTAEYKFLVKEGTSNLFGVPLTNTGLVTGKTLVYDGSGWVYDNAGPADGTQTGEILAWDGTEWSANSAVVVEGTSVGIGSTQPTQKLDVIGSVKATGSLTGASATVTGQLQGATVSSTEHVIATGSLTGASATVTGQLQGATVSSTGHVIATGSLTGDSATVTGQVQGATISSTGQVVATGSLTGASATVTGQLQGATVSSTGHVIATGSLTGASATVSGRVQGATVSSTGHVIATGSLTGSSVTVTGDIQGLNLTSTGTLSADGITSSDNVIITGADKSLTASNITTSNLTVSNFHSITGTLSASNVETSNLTVSNRLSGGTISVSNIEATANLVVGGPADITGTLSVGGSLTGASSTVTGQVQGATVSSTGHVIATGSLTGASSTVTGQVQGATVSSTGHVIATGSVTGTTVNTPTLVVSNDAQITGNLTVSGGLVTITSTTTGTNQINITNNGTGPALIAKQTGAQPIVNFLDDSASALFISGGELTGKDGFVGLGTETPQERLDVQGNIVSSGTISSTNVETSNLTVTNFHSVTGTLTASNIATSNLTVSNRLSGGTISVSNVEATANLVVGGPVNITGTLSAGGSLTGPSVTVSGQVQGATVSSTGQVVATGSLTGASATVTGQVQGATVSSTGQVIATGSLTGASATVTGQVQGATVSSTGQVIATGSLTGASATVTGQVRGSTISSTGNVNATGNVVATGSLTGASATVSGQVQGATISSTGQVIATGSLTGASATVSGQVQGATVSSTGTVQGLNLTSTGTLSAAGITSSDNVIITGADKSLTASNISTSNLTVSNFHSITGTLSASNVETSNLTVTNLNSVTNDAFVGGTLSASNVETSNLTVNGNTYISSNLGVGTADTAEYKFLVNDGTSNLFGVPYDKTALTTGKTIVYNGSGWVYDNAGPADGTQTGEILSWDGSEWSANSAVVVEGSNVGIGSTQPREILDVTGNVRVTQSVLINETFQGRAMRLNDTPASNLHYQPNFTITGSLTSAGDIKTNQAFRGHNMFLSNVLTISGGVVTNTGTVNTTINGSLTVQGDAVVNSNISAVTVNTGSLVATGDASIAGTLTASNIVGASPVTISSGLVMGSGSTLTTSNIVGSSFLTVTANTNVVAEFTESSRYYHVKEPRSAMTASSSFGYTASASSYYNNDVTFIPWQAFDGVIDNDTVWISGNDTYDGSGIATSSDSFNSVNGSYITIELPTNIKLNYAYIYGRDSTNSNPRRPKTGILYGSTDNSSWTEIGNFSIASLPSIAFGPEIIPHTTGYYKYFRLQITSVFTTGINDACAITELELYGTPYTSATNDGTDVIFKSVPNTPKTDFLEVYYDAKEYSGSGNITDETGNGNTGTPSANVSFTSTDPKSWNFDGITANISATFNSNTLDAGNVHSICMWIKPSTIQSGYKSLFGLGENSDNKSIGVFLNNGYVVYLTFSNNLISSYAVESDKWYFITCTYSPGRKIYVNSQLVASDTYSSFNITNFSAKLGANLSNGELFDGSIANYRLYDRALSADEVWELYGYQKAYFSVSPDVVTYKAGRVGIGTSEPRAVLDVVGSLNLANGITYNNIRSMFSAYSTNGDSSASWPIILEKTGYNIGNHYDTTTGWYTVPITGIYSFNILVFATNGVGSTQYALKMKPGGQSVFGNDNWKANRLATGGDDSFLIYAVGGFPFSGSLDIYCEEGDMVGWGHRSTTVSLYYAHCAFSGRLITPI